MKKNILHRGLSGGFVELDIEDYLTIEALEDGLTASLSINACEYCVDFDGNWKTLAADTVTESINSGQTLSFRGNLTPNSLNGIGTFTVNKNFNLKGNVMSMLFGDAGKYNYSLRGKNYAFYKLFYNCPNVVNVSENFLPATTLASSCYRYMFYGCNSLTTTPELPATTLAEDCYQYMFSYCSSLTTAPELPATVLTNYCYSGMFRDCASLTTAPELPATVLTNYCYSGMFQRCTSLTTAPELPATTLATYCYYYMFYDCTKLNYIKMLATDISATGCLNSWVSNVSSIGTFVKNPAMNSLPTGTSGIPSGWTVVNDGEESGGDTPEFTLHLYTKKKQNYSVYHIEPCKETLALVDYFWENAVEGPGEWDLHLPAGSLYIDGWEPDQLVVFKNDPDRADFEVYKNYDGISMPRGQLYVTGEKKGLLEIYDEY